MTHSNDKSVISNNTQKLTRRQVLVRLGIATTIIYSTPAMFEISAAHASTASGSSGSSSSSGPSDSNGGSSGPSEPSSGPSGGATGPSTAVSGPSAATSGPSGTVSGAKARKAVRKKKILPLRKIVKTIEKETKANVISQKLKLVNKQYIYQLKIVTKRGIVKTIKVDAATAKIINEGLS